MIAPSSIDSFMNYPPSCDDNMRIFGQQVCLPWSGFPSKVMDKCLNNKHLHLSVIDKVFKALHSLNSDLRKKNKSTFQRRRNLI